MYLVRYRMSVYGMMVLRFDIQYGKNTVCDMVYVGMVYGKNTLCGMVCLRCGTGKRNNVCGMVFGGMVWCPLWMYYIAKLA